MKWGSLIKALPIPGIGALAQTAEGLSGVVQAVQKATGHSEPDKALEAIQTDPETLAAVKIRAAELATEHLRIVTADLADARRNAPRDRLRSMVGWVTALVFVLAFGLVGASAIMREPLHDDPIALMFFGNITGAWLTLQAFYFGNMDRPSL